jgi:hypothetical protein
MKSTLLAAVAAIGFTLPVNAEILNTIADCGNLYRQLGALAEAVDSMARRC